MPSANVRARTGPSDHGGSGTSSTRAEPAMPGDTVSARIFSHLHVSPPFSPARRHPAKYDVEVPQRFLEYATKSRLTSLLLLWIRGRCDGSHWTQAVGDSRMLHPR